MANPAASTGNLKSYKFQFDVIVEKVELTVGFNCQVWVVWKRGRNKIETKNKAPLDGKNNLATFNEKLTMCSNMYFNDGLNSFYEKKTVFNVILATSKGVKTAGLATLDLGALINNKVVELQECYKLTNCPDKNAKLYLNMKTTFMGEVKAVDAVSQITDMSRLNESFEALTSENLEAENKKTHEDSSASSNGMKPSPIAEPKETLKEKESAAEKMRFLEEKLKYLQKENNELLKDLEKKVAI